VQDDGHDRCTIRGDPSSCAFPTLPCDPSCPATSIAYTDCRFSCHETPWKNDNAGAWFQYPNCDGTRLTQRTCKTSHGSYVSSDDRRCSTLFYGLTDKSGPTVKDSLLGFPSGTFGDSIDIFHLSIEYRINDRCALGVCGKRQLLRFEIPLRHQFGWPKRLPCNDCHLQQPTKTILSRG
jgi:hypothetical protein